MGRRERRIEEWTCCGLIFFETSNAHKAIYGLYRRWMSSLVVNNGEENRDWKLES